MIRMVQLPEPTAREVRWSFIVVAACAMALTATICWGIVHKVNQSDEIVRVAVSSANEVDRLSAQLDAQSGQLDALKRQAAEDASIAARDLRALRAQNRRLLDLLRELGIESPESVATPRARAGGGSDPKGDGPRGPKPSPSPTPPASPKPPPATPSPSPAAPDVCGLLPLLCP